MFALLLLYEISLRINLGLKINSLVCSCVEVHHFKPITSFCFKQVIYTGFGRSLKENWEYYYVQLLSIKHILVLHEHTKNILPNKEM